LTAQPVLHVGCSASYQPFPEIGAAREASSLVRIGQVGSATARLLPQREAVDLAVGSRDRCVGFSLALDPTYAPLTA
jgi:aminoglycoside N3'-acetyltransferase